MTAQGILNDMFSGTFTVWYRDLLSLVRDKSRLFGSLVMTLIMLVGIGFGLGNAIGSRSTFDSGRTTGTGLVILAIYGFITVALAFRWKTAAR